MRDRLRAWLAARTARARERWPYDARQTRRLAIVVGILVGLIGVPAMAALLSSHTATIQQGSTFKPTEGPTVIVDENLSVQLNQTFPDNSTVALGGDRIGGGQYATASMTGFGDQWLAAGTTINGSSIRLERDSAALSITVSEPAGGAWTTIELQDNATLGNASADIQGTGDGRLAVHNLSVSSAGLEDMSTGSILDTATVSGGSATFDNVSLVSDSVAVVNTTSSGGGGGGGGGGGSTPTPTQTLAPIDDPDGDASQWTQGGWLSAIFAPYIELLGSALLGTILAGSLILGFWIFSGDLGMPAIILLLLGGVLLPVLPGEVTQVARVLLVLGLATAFLAVARKYIL